MLMIGLFVACETEKQEPESIIIDGVEWKVSGSDAVTGEPILDAQGNDCPAGYGACRDDSMQCCPQTDDRDQDQ